MSDKPVPEQWKDELLEHEPLSITVQLSVQEMFERMQAAEAALSEANKVIEQLKQQGCPLEAELDVTKAALHAIKKSDSWLKAWTLAKEALEKVGQ